MFGSPEGLLGQVIGGYRLEAVLGTGAMGVVFRGRALAAPQQTVAIKLLIIPFSASAQDRAQYQARFRREAETLQRLKHPQVLSLLAFGEEQGFAFMVLPFMEGGTLADRLAKHGGRLSLQEASYYLSQVASALDYAHRQQVVHRDIKPGNILLDAEGRPALADFSIVRFTDLGHPTFTVPGQVLGTPAYLAPEQEDPRQIGPATDIYSLGIVIYELVAGQVPFEGSSPSEYLQKHAKEVPPSPRSFRPALPEAAEAVLLQALAKQPAERFSSAGAFASAFSAGLQGQWAPGVRGPGDRTKQFTPSPTVDVSPPPVGVRPAIAPTPPAGQPASGPATPTGGGQDPSARGAGSLPLAPAPGVSSKQRPSGFIALVTLLLLVLVLGGSGVALGLAGRGPLAALGPKSQPTPSPTSSVRPTVTPTPKPPAGSITEFLLPTAQALPGGIAAGPDGNLWFAEGGSSKIGRITPQGAITEFALPTTQNLPIGIAAGPDGNLWFAERGGNQIGRITTGGTITEFRLPTTTSGPETIVAGPDENLWFTEFDGNRIGRITPQGAITEFPVPTAQSNPCWIAAGPDNNLWFTEYTGNKIGQITPQGAITEFAIPTVQSNPCGIAAGLDKNLWFTEIGGDKIGRITPQGGITEFAIPTVQSSPNIIVVGPDGNLWFIEYTGNNIGRLTPHGPITEFPIPTAQSNPGGIAVGPDGNLWFTERGGNKIGRITSGQ